MGRLRALAFRSCVLLLSLEAGCATLLPGTPTPDLLSVPQAAQPAGLPVVVQAAAWEQGETAASTPAREAISSVLPFAGQADLSADAVVQQVLVRNPSLAEMTAAWRAAQARYPQVTALEDPMVGVQVAPGAFGSNTVDGGYRLEVSQKFPWPGKRDARGQGALAEAQAAGNDVEDMRLQLAESARSAFFDYYEVERALEVNRDGLVLLDKFHEEAESRYEKRAGEQQEVFQTEVEIGTQRERRLTLERRREVSIARINTLLHLPPDAPLPAPAKDIPGGATLPDVAALRQAALERRPDLQALANRIAADRAAVALAKKEFCPDVELMAAYDTIWQERALRPQIGLRVNLPVQEARRYAAVAEAESRVAQREAELARQTDQVNLQVQEAMAQVHESEQIVALYEAKTLRAARENVEAAGRSFGAGKIPFLSLIEAQRNLVMVQDRYYEAIASLGRRRASLERVVGGPVAAPSTERSAHP
jgi:outer membrane protein, heavy metal efflux system